jgi:hypothetical protein
LELFGGIFSRIACVTKTTFSIFLFYIIESGFTSGKVAIAVGVLC